MSDLRVSVAHFYSLYFFLLTFSAPEKASVAQSRKLLWLTTLQPFGVICSQGTRSVSLSDVLIRAHGIQGIYLKWCKANNFDSMLPEDAKARRTEAHEALKQTRVGDHFTTIDPANDHKKLDPFTQDLFKEAAIQWLVETDQVCRRYIIIFILINLNHFT